MSLKYLIRMNAKRFLTFSPPDVDLEKNIKPIKINNTYNSHILYRINLVNKVLNNKKLVINKNTKNNTKITKTLWNK